MGARDRRRQPRRRAGRARPTTRRSSTSCCGTSASPASCVWADRRCRLGGGRAFALYLALYAVGRFWIEGLRIDDANSFAGLRLNEWVMGVVLLGALTYLVAAARRRPRAASWSRRRAADLAEERA